MEPWLLGWVIDQSGFHWRWTASIWKSTIPIRFRLSYHMYYEEWNCWCCRGASCSHATRCSLPHNQHCQVTLLLSRPNLLQVMSVPVLECSPLFPVVRRKVEFGRVQQGQTSKKDCQCSTLSVILKFGRIQCPLNFMQPFKCYVIVAAVSSVKYWTVGPIIIL